MRSPCSPRRQRSRALRDRQGEKNADVLEGTPGQPDDEAPRDTLVLRTRTHDTTKINACANTLGSGYSISYVPPPWLFSGPLRNPKTAGRARWPHPRQYAGRPPPHRGPVREPSLPARSHLRRRGATPPSPSACTRAPCTPPPPASRLHEHERAHGRAHKRPARAASRPVGDGLRDGDGPLARLLARPHLLGLGLGLGSGLGLGLGLGVGLGLGFGLG